MSATDRPATSLPQPVSACATGLMKVMMPARSVAMTPSPMLVRVTRSNSL